MVLSSPVMLSTQRLTSSPPDLIVGSGGGEDGDGIWHQNFTMLRSTLKITVLKGAVFQWVVVFFGYEAYQEFA